MKFVLNKKTVGSLLMSFSLILLFIFILVKLDVDAEQSFLCRIVEESPELSMEECPAHESSISWLLFAGFGIAFLVLVSGFYLIFAPQKETKAGTESEKVAAIRKVIDPATLPEEEKQLYDRLILSDGSLYQSDLIKETGLSKVKISRILDKMEGKGILERKRRGMTNIVVLK